MSPPSAPLSLVTPDLEVTTSSLQATATKGCLQGSRCDDCGARAFPARSTCHRCCSPRLASHELGTTGLLYSWTTVHVSSSRPVPYSIGYIDIDDEVRVLGRLTGDGHRIGGRVDIVTDGTMWAFAARHVQS